MKSRKAMRLIDFLGFSISFLSPFFRLVLRLISIFLFGLILTTIIMFHSETLLASTFTFSIQTDPESLDPITANDSITSYTLNSLYMPLLRYNHGLKGGGAVRCTQSSTLHYNCILKSDWRWSDGKPVVASQIVFGWKELMNQGMQKSEKYQNIKFIKAKNDHQVDFFLKQPDHDFLFRLIDPAFSPRRPDIDMKLGKVTPGLYYLSNKIPGRSLHLKPNKYLNSNNKPDVEILIVNSDDTGLKLYQSHQLNFLRRLSTENVSQYKKSTELMQVKFLRFDYVGFGPQLISESKLREKLIYGLTPQLKKFIKVFEAIDRPGCFAMPIALNDDLRCYSFKTALAYSDKERSQLPKLTLAYALQGGDDVRREMELFQAGWKSNINVPVTLQPLEFGVLSQQLKTAPPTLFRRGVPLDRPTCLAALELFSSDNPNNFIKLKSAPFDLLISKMRTTKSEKTYKHLCRESFVLLKKMHRIIPLGEIHIAMLNDQKFSNFSINELNQLDLTDLHETPLAAKDNTKGQ